jgi:hypothetical protein
MFTSLVDYSKQHPDFLLFAVFIYLHIMMFAMYTSLERKIDELRRELTKSRGQHPAAP